MTPEGSNPDSGGDVQPRRPGWLVPLVIAAGVMAVLGLGAVVLAVTMSTGASESGDGLAAESPAERASDRAAQSDLRSALTAAKVVATDTGQFPPNAAPLREIEPSLNLVDAGTPQGQGVIVYAVEGGVSYFATESSTGDCLYVRADLSTVDFARDSECGPAAEQSYSATGWE